MDIFVGNLLFSSTEADVKKLFEGFGSVASVRIVMEKKGDKSRGFGFVQMPDGQQAQAAITAINGQEFMGRPLRVSPARPKPEVECDKAKVKNIRSDFEGKGQEYTKKERARKDAWYNPVFNRKRGRYKTGRRSRSFMKRHAASGIAQEAVPKQESRENPLRWRKNYEQPKPWQETQGVDKPWKKVEGKSRTWRKAEGGPRPWSKSARRDSKPWRRAEGAPKPWKKRGKPNPRRNSGKRPRPRQSQVESRRKPGGYAR